MSKLILKEIRRKSIENISTVYKKLSSSACSSLVSQFNLENKLKQNHRFFKESSLSHRYFDIDVRNKINITKNKFGENLSTDWLECNVNYRPKNTRNERIKKRSAKEFLKAFHEVSEKCALNSGRQSSYQFFKTEVNNALIESIKNDMKQTLNILIKTRNESRPKSTKENLHFSNCSALVPRSNVFNMIETQKHNTYFT